jgi:hypothetical protein
MKDNCKDICGVTPPVECPECPPDHPCIQLCETDRLRVECPDPDIGELVNLTVTITISKFKVIHTQLGPKLIVNAIKHIRAVYKAADAGQAKFSLSEDIPFCFFILLDDDEHNVAKVATVVEDINVVRVNQRCIAVSTVIFAFPVFRQAHSHCDDDSIRCDIRMKNASK